MEKESNFEGSLLSLPNDYGGFIRYVARVYFDKDVKFTKKFFNALRNLNPGHAYLVGAMILAKLIDSHYANHVLEDAPVSFSHVIPEEIVPKIFPIVRNEQEADMICRILGPITESVASYLNLDSNE